MPYERDSYIFANVGVGTAQVATNNTDRKVRSTSVGAVYTADDLDDLIRLGYGYCAGIGLLSAAEALPAAAITTLRPQLWIRVPTGVTIRPFYAAVQVEDTGATNAFEITLGIAREDVGNGTSSAADFGPLNLLSSKAGNDSGCFARQEATADVTADIDCDLWRVFKAEDNVTTVATSGPLNFEWAPRRGLPALVGPASWMMYIGSSAAPLVTAQLQFIVEPAP